MEQHGARIFESLSRDFEQGKKSMKVLIVSQYFWPENFSINSMVRSVLDRGIQVDVLTGKPNYPEGYIYSGYKTFGCQTEQWHTATTIHRLPIVPRGTKNAIKLMLNYLSFIFSGLIFAPWLLRKQHYDAVLVYAPSPILQAIPAIFLGWLKRAKVLIWVQDLWPESLAATGHVRSPFILKAVEVVVRWIYKHADLLLVQSREFVQPIAAMAPSTRVAYLPNSVEASFATPPSKGIDLPSILELDTGFAVVFAGNVGAGQAVEVIVEAAALLKEVPAIRFIVFGQGSRWNWMHEQIEERGLRNVHLPGRFPVDTMPAIMQKAGALLVTLTDDPIFEKTVPNKIQAYLAAGRPILACLNGEGARLVIEAQAGLSVPAQDAIGLAEAVMQLYQMPHEAREHMGIQGRNYYKKYFDHDKLVDELIAHLRVTTGLELLQSHPQA
jgi:glycosyltransferase involved in cell wall biosynthesis